MERLTNKNPCDNCTSDKQIGNPYYWQCECDKCLKSVKWRSECVKKLKDYEDLEEQELLLKPKCRPGDIVWEANKERNIVSEYEVASIRYGINKTFHYMWVLRNGIYSNLDGFRDKDINKTVFLTQVEAEEKLKKIESEE